MEGWRCPGCGRCYSPFVMRCEVCGGSGLFEPRLTYRSRGATTCPSCGRPRATPAGTGCPPGWHDGSSCQSGVTRHPVAMFELQEGS